MPAGLRVIHRVAGVLSRIFYRVDAIGEAPAAGPVLLLPNHPNALLDPALVMASAGRPVRFLAKSTLFKGPFAPLLRAAHAIPVYRKQDGALAARNQQTFAEVEAALASGEAICVFPEGISHSSGTLEPLRTGAARMALSAAASGTPVRLVAVGINLERKTIFRSRATVAYGTPFAVDAGSGTDPNQVRTLTDTIAAHMRALLVEADPRTDAELVDRIDRLYRSERPEPDDPEGTLARRKVIARAIHRLRAERPDWYEGAMIQLRRYDDRLRRFGLRDTSLDWQTTPAAAMAFIVRELPLAGLLAPVALAAAVVFAVPYVLTAAVASGSKAMDVTATAKVLGGLVIYGSWTVLLCVAAGIVAEPVFALVTAVCLPLLAVAGLVALEREASAWRTARSWLALRGAHRTTRNALRRRRAELADVMDQVNDWMSADDR